MKKKTAFILALLFTAALCGCNDTGKKSNEVLQDLSDSTLEVAEILPDVVPVDWEDFIKINGITYVGDWRQTEVDPDKIGEQIGEVSCGVPVIYSDENGNTTDAEPKNGSSYLCSIGTELFSVTGNEYAIAAYVDGAYYLYSMPGMIVQNNWGITLVAENVTTTGLTIVCHQSGGENVAELDTGSFYTIQKLENSSWKTVEYLPHEYEIGWTAEAWIIQKDSTTTWDVDWEWLYGALPSGEYRIGKEIMNFRKTGDYDIEMAYAEFTIE